MRLQPPTLQPWKPGPHPEKDIVVLMSGGVDSSVTALLLRQRGWNVLGVTMKIPVAQGCDYKRSCCGMEAGYVCRDLGIPHYYLDAQDAFERSVIEPFRAAYAKGRTPSPCVDCNTEFKFSQVWDFVERELAVANLATGHYARVIGTADHPRLARASDRNKDQSYFLYGVPGWRLSHLHLPLGEMTKDQVREHAREARLPVARRPDSMELCFVGEGNYRSAVDQSPRGAIVDTQGNVLGEHDGIANYTIGQRRGLGVAGDQPRYVVAIEAATNTVVVGLQEDTKRTTVEAEEARVLLPEEMRVGALLYGKIRSQGEPSACTVTDVRACEFAVEFGVAQLAPAPGQRLVLYSDQGYVVAGGTIRSGDI